MNDNQVTDFMNRDPIFVTNTTRIAEIKYLLSKYDLKEIFVVDEEKHPVGVVSFSDVETDEIDDVFKKLSANGMEFVHGIVEQPWGSRAFRVYDPDRNIVELAEPMDSVAIRLFQSGITMEEV